MQVDGFLLFMIALKIFDAFLLASCVVGNDRYVDYEHRRKFSFFLVVRIRVGSIDQRIDE